ncbi:MAG: hypothetical protein AAGN66_21470 [Acidobacteriota bacterium]
MHWLDGMDEEKDLCAHGVVTVAIGGVTLADPADGEQCVSAAALHLLRTLESDHTPESPVGEHLVPHCGHGLYEGPTPDADVVIVGCSSGVDWQVVHGEGAVTLRNAGGAEAQVSLASWGDAVCAFSDRVEAFYKSSSPKVPDDDVEAAGFEAFRREWRRRRDSAGTALKG